MMNYQNWISDPSLPITLDTSVVINLAASGFGEKILEAIPNPVIVVDIVFLELDEERKYGRSDAERFQSAGLLEIVELDEQGDLIFESLVTGPAISTIDDGEAASIAYALTAGVAVLIDDGKAIKICREKYPTLAMGSSAALFAHPAIEATLGHDLLTKAVLNALHLARMRILPDYLLWVVDLIGIEQAKQCLSLPRSVRLIQESSDGLS